MQEYVPGATRLFHQAHRAWMLIGSTTQVGAALISTSARTHGRVTDREAGSEATAVLHGSELFRLLHPSVPCDVRSIVNRIPLLSSTGTRKAPSVTGELATFDIHASSIVNRVPLPDSTDKLTHRLIWTTSPR